MLSGISFFCPGEANLFPICEAARHKKMGGSVMLREERCLCFDMCDVAGRLWMIFKVWLYLRSHSHPSRTWMMLFYEIHLSLSDDDLLTIQTI